MSLYRVATTVELHTGFCSPVIGYISMPSSPWCSKGFKRACFPAINHTTALWCPWKYKWIWLPDFYACSSLWWNTLLYRYSYSGHLLSFLWFFLIRNQFFSHKTRPNHPPSIPPSSPPTSSLPPESPPLCFLFRKEMTAHHDKARYNKTRPRPSNRS